MRIPASPAPSPERVEAVSRTRRIVDEALRQRRSRDVVLLAFAAYTLACREAGALEPPSLAAWPDPQPRSEPPDNPPRRSDSA